TQIRDVDQYLTEAIRQLRAADTAEKAATAQQWIETNRVTPKQTMIHVDRLDRVVLSLEDFATRWTMMLRDEEADNLGAAVIQLRVLLENAMHGGITLVPGEELFDRYRQRREMLRDRNRSALDRQAADIDKAVAAANELTDLARLEQIVQLELDNQEYGTSYQKELKGLLGSIRGLQLSCWRARKRDRSKVGLIMGYGNSTEAGHRWISWVDEMTKLVELEIVERTGQLEGLNRNEGESILEVLLRTADEARSAGQWLRVHGLLQA
ncbi:unnamed protein product, partial [marine sediment metagenome]